MKPLDRIKWATPENPHGLWASCIICGKDIRGLRTRKNTCSEQCRIKKQHDIDNKSYANKMANDPLYAQKQSAKQYTRIKADPEKMEAKRIAQNERMQMPNYKESAKKSQSKYRSKPDTKAKIAERMREYRDDHPEIISSIEAKRIEKRKAEREYLRTNEVARYEALLAAEREDAMQRKAAKRLAELQQDLEKLVNNNE